MKKILIIISAILFCFQSISFCQEKKPTLMILPSDNWCKQRYFMTSYDNQGVTVETPNYQQAFVEDSELPIVISKIGELLTARGYSLKDAEMETKAVYARMAEDNLTKSKTSGSSIAESPLDMVKRRAKMDIIIQVWWKINKEYGSSKSITFTLEAFDAYTSKRIATSSGTGEASEANMSVLLESAVRNHIDAFDNQMSMWYNNLYVQGREIVLQCKRWDSWENDLETEYEGEELLDVIQNWLEAHTVNGMFNLSDATENMAQFEQVRIPLFNANGVPMDARAFTVELRKYLAKEPYNITSKVLIRGLGEAIIILGEK